MAYDLNKITKEYYDVCKRAGVTVTAPVKINTRLTSTLGRVKSCNGEVVSVEFSKRFIDLATDKEISEVIKHEAAHQIVLERAGGGHGHDDYFKAVCAEIGASATGTSFDWSGAAEETSFKYDLYCKTCGKVIGHRKRMCAVVKQPDKYCCAICGKSTLSIIQNW